MQAHFTKAIASVTYLVKMQSRAPSPSHLQADRFVLRRSSMLCWVGVSCCVKVVIGEGLDHAGADGNVCLLEVSFEYYNILRWNPVTRQALFNRAKTFCCFSNAYEKHRFDKVRLFIREHVIDKGQYKQCSGKLHWMSFLSWLIKMYCNSIWTLPKWIKLNTMKTTLILNKGFTSYDLTI